MRACYKPAESKYSLDLAREFVISAGLLAHYPLQRLVSRRTGGALPPAPFWQTGRPLLTDGNAFMTGTT